MLFQKFQVVDYSIVRKSWVITFYLLKSWKYVQWFTEVCANINANTYSKRWLWLRRKSALSTNWKVCSLLKACYLFCLPLVQFPSNYFKDTQHTILSCNRFLAVFLNHLVVVSRCVLHQAASNKVSKDSI